MIDCQVHTSFDGKSGRAMLPTAESARWRVSSSCHRLTVLRAASRDEDGASLSNSSRNRPEKRSMNGFAWAYPADFHAVPCAQRPSRHPAPRQGLSGGIKIAAGGLPSVPARRDEIVRIPSGC
jgi:hypothetical protein